MVKYGNIRHKAVGLLAIFAFRQKTAGVIQDWDLAGKRQFTIG